MKKVKNDLYAINRKYGEECDRFRADDRNSQWQKYCLLVSTKLLSCQQAYIRQAAKDLAQMVKNGELDMEKITTVKTILTETSSKEFIVPECMSSALEILDALNNTFGEKGVFQK